MSEVIYIWEHKQCHLSKFKRFARTDCVLKYISFVVTTSSLNDDMNGITFVMLAVDEPVALMSSSKSGARLLSYVHEQFVMSLNLLCSTIYIHTYIYIYTHTICKRKHNTNVHQVNPHNPHQGKHWHRSITSNRDFM